VTRIASKGGECFSRRSEEQIVNDPRPIERQRTKLVGQGEDDVEVFNREQVGTSRLGPVGLSQRLTLGTVSVAARVIDGTPVPAAITGFEVPAEGGRSAITECADHLVLDGTQPMGRRITLPMTAQEVA
jgi:hypothetical protein